MTGQTGQALVFTGDTGQTGVPYRCTENLQKQLQPPLGF
jgi:hypothetical protein